MSLDPIPSNAASFAEPKQNPVSPTKGTNNTKRISLETIVYYGFHGAIGAQCILLGNAFKASEFATTALATSSVIIATEIVNRSRCIKPITVMRSAAVIAGAATTLAITSAVQTLPEVIHSLTSETLPVVMAQSFSLGALSTLVSTTAGGIIPLL